MSSRPLRELPVLVLDCQASGANPTRGALLEAGWTVCDARGPLAPIVAHWIIPPSGHQVPPVVRRLTGWSEDCLAGALAAERAWAYLTESAASIPTIQIPTIPAPTVIHYASFELPFLRDLHERAGCGERFPLDVLCLHAMARRLYPELPRRGLRALSGFLGHSPELLRRSAGHVEASAFVWRELVPVLEDEGVGTWDDLRAWLQAPAPRRGRLVYPMAIEKRRALPDAPGVYRFVRSNGDILYVGKAASLKRRVPSHFAPGARKVERALEMLTQARDVVVTTTATALEAALLECDEIKRLDPPYNVQLRQGERRVWFASARLDDASSRPDRAHSVGPLPSERALSGFAGLGALVSGAEATDTLRAHAVGVPPAFAPHGALFDEVWPGFVAFHRLRDTRRGVPWPSMMRAARALFRARGGPDVDDDAPPGGWDPGGVRRHLDRNLLRGGHLVRRARWLCVFCNCSIAFREAGDGAPHRLLVVARGEIALQRGWDAQSPLPAPVRLSWSERQGSFDAIKYDRIRVLVTELERVHHEGGFVAVRLPEAELRGDRVARVLRWA